MPQSAIQNPVFNAMAPKIAAMRLSAGFGSLYFPGVKAVAQGDIPLMDGEIPAANGVATARGLARMYGAIANGGRIDGTRFLSRELVAGLSGRRSLRPDGNLLIPLAFHLGYHRVPFDAIPGFGHVGLGGSLGWADPDSGLAFGFVHNRLLSPFVVLDHAGFVATGALLRRGAVEARKHGFERVADLGAAVVEPGAAVG
jgi:CubicO group peptidase (beta-lactamase class C family)